jgi:hypothetical protein
MREVGQVVARLRTEVAALDQHGAQQRAAPLEDQEAERLGVPGRVDPAVEEMTGRRQLHPVLFIPGHLREQGPDASPSPTRAGRTPDVSPCVP